LSDDELWKSYADAKALFTIRVTILNVVVPNILIRKCLESLDDFYPAIIG